MAQKKISELTSTASVKDHNIFPLVQDGVTKHIKYSDLKAPLVKEVEAEVETYVDNKIDTRTRYGVTTMTELGFENNSTVSVSSLWARLCFVFGVNGVIKFRWSGVEGAYVGSESDKANIYGGTLIYTCNSAPTNWAAFSAIYISDYDDGIFRIQCSMGSDVTKENWLVTKLADNNHILELRSGLSDANERINKLCRYYPNVAVKIGNWHDGRNIMRLVVKSDSDDFTLGAVSYQNATTIALRLDESLPKDNIAYVISAKLYSKNETSAIELNANDLLSSGTTGLTFTRNIGSLDTTKSTYDCVVVEYVAK